MFYSLQIKFSLQIKILFVMSKTLVMYRKTILGPHTFVDNYKAKMVENVFSNLHRN